MLGSKNFSMEVNLEEGSKMFGVDGGQAFGRYSGEKIRIAKNVIKKA